MFGHNLYTTRSSENLLAKFTSHGLDGATKIKNNGYPPTMTSVNTFYIYYLRNIVVGRFQPVRMTSDDFRVDSFEVKKIRRCKKKR